VKRFVRDYIHVAEKIGWLLVVGTFAYALVAERKFDWHSGVHILLVVVAVLLAVISWGLRELRKRLSAGITRYHENHRAADSFRKLWAGQEKYFYWGWTFQTCLPDFQEALKSRVAKGASIRLLLIDPAELPLMDRLGQLDTPVVAAREMQVRLAKQLIATLSALESVGGIELRAHRRLGRMWMHIFDRAEIIFGMVPAG